MFVVRGRRRFGTEQRAEEGERRHRFQQSASSSSSAGEYRREGFASEVAPASGAGGGGGSGGGAESVECADERGDGWKAHVSKEGDGVDEWVSFYRNWERGGEKGGEGVARMREEEKKRAVLGSVGVFGWGERMFMESENRWRLE